MSFQTGQHISRRTWGKWISKTGVDGKTPWEGQREKDNWLWLEETQKFLFKYSLEIE